MQGVEGSSPLSPIWKAVFAIGRNRSFSSVAVFVFEHRTGGRIFLSVAEFYTLYRLYNDKEREESRMSEISYEIIETLGVLSTNHSGWQKELNKISWNGRAPKYDLRDWAPDHAKMGKGVTLSAEELQALKALLDNLPMEIK